MNKRPSGHRASRDGGTVQVERARLRDFELIERSLVYLGRSWKLLSRSKRCLELCRLYRWNRTGEAGPDV